MKTVKATLRVRPAPSASWGMPHEETVEVHNHDYDDEALVLIVDVEEQPGGQISIAFSREQLAALYGEGK